MFVLEFCFRNCFQQSSRRFGRFTVRLGRNSGDLAFNFAPSFDPCGIVCRMSHESSNGNRCCTGLSIACAADGVKLLARGNNNRLRISAQLLVLARCLVLRNVYLFSIGSRKNR